MGELDGDLGAMVKVENIIEWAIREQKTIVELPEHYASWLDNNEYSTVKSKEVLTYIEEQIEKRTKDRQEDTLGVVAAVKKKKGRTKKKATGAPRRHHTKGFHKTKKQPARKKSLAQSKKKKKKKKKGGNKYTGAEVQRIVNEQLVEYGDLLQEKCLEMMNKIKRGESQTESGQRTYLAVANAGIRRQQALRAQAATRARAPAAPAARRRAAPAPHVPRLHRHPTRDFSRSVTAENTDS